MKVLLTQTIAKIGIVGEVIDVSEGFARNYLLPKKLGITPTAGNIARLEVAKKEYEAKLAAARAEKEALVAKLAGVEVHITRASNDEGHLFGSVSKRDIAEELNKLGYTISADDVKLDEPLRRVDTFTVPVQLAGDLKADIKVWVVREKSTTEEAAKPAAKTEEPAQA
jgi:large subunit ribosomal protein L9